jgi:hypothetical protein
MHTSVTNTFSRRAWFLATPGGMSIRFNKSICSFLNLSTNFSGVNCLQGKKAQKKNNTQTYVTNNKTWQPQEIK